MKKSKIIVVIGTVMLLGSVIVYLKTTTNTNPIADYAVAAVILGNGLLHMAMSYHREGN